MSSYIDLQKMRTFLVVFLMGLPFASTQAEIIYFRDGSEIQGKITGQDQNTIRLQTEEGTVRVISKDSIQRIVYNHSITPEDQSAIEEERSNRIRKQKEKEELLAKAKTTTPQESLEKDESSYPILVEIPDHPTIGGAFVRSMFIPGWGQFYQGRPGAGYGFGVLFLGGSYGLYEKHRIYMNSTRDLARMENPFHKEQTLLRALDLPTRPLHGVIFWDALMANDDALAQKAYWDYQLSDRVSQQKTVMRHRNELVTARQAVVGIYVLNLLDVLFNHPPGYETVLGFQENLDRGRVRLGFDSLSSPLLPGAGLSSLQVEHRAFLEIQF